jgi:HlyD family secretion protein
MQAATALPPGSDYAVALTALAQARASADAATSRLRYATIKAPVAGILIKRNVEPGDVVQPGKTLMTLSPEGQTQLVVQIDERNLKTLRVGQPAQASADAYADRCFAAELVYINPGIDAQRGSVEVKLAVPQPPDYLRQDMTVSVDIMVASRQQALVVPLLAVHDAEGPKAWVLKAEHGGLVRQHVLLGLRSAGMAEVVEGLAPGDLVVPVNVAPALVARARPVVGEPPTTAAACRG